MKKIIAVIASVSSAVASLPAAVSASSPVSYVAVCASGAQNFFGIQPWYACLPQNPDGSVKITKLNDLFLVIFPLVESLVKIGALVAAGVIFFMLVQMIMARGNAGKIATHVEGIKQAVIGFIICLLSVAIVNFISGAIQ